MGCVRERQRERERRGREREREFSTNLLCAVKNVEYKHEYGNSYSYNIWREQGRKLMELKYETCPITQDPFIP